MIEMRYANPPAMRVRQLNQRIEQHHRIHTTGDRHENFLPARKQAPGLNPVFNALEKFAHAAILLFFQATGKQA